MVGSMMNPEFDDNNLIFSLFSSLTIAAIIFLTGCTGKKKTAAMESDYEQPPPLQTPVLAKSKTSSASKGGPGTAPIETRLPNIPEQPKEQQVPPPKEEGAPPPEEKKPEEVKNVEGQKGEEKKSDKKDENEKKSEIKKSEKNDEGSKASTKVDSKESSKSKSKVASEKKNEDNYQPINFGPDDLPPAPK